MLETELGVSLFTRLPRGMALTPAGTAFLIEAKSVLEGARRAAARATLAARGQEGEIAIGLTTSAILHPAVPALMGEYVRRYPQVAIRIQEGNAADLTDMLTARKLDVAFIRAVVARPHGLVFTELLEEELLVAVPAGHRLANRQPEKVRLGELAGERFILVRRRAAPGMYADLVDACREAGFEPMVATEVGRMLTNISLVAAGIGISLVPASMREIHLGGVRYLRLRQRPRRLRAPLTIAVHSAETGPTVTNLLRLAVVPTSRSARR